MSYYDYLGGQRKKKSKKKGYVIIKGRAYPIGSTKPKRRSESTESSYGGGYYGSHPKNEYLFSPGGKYKGTLKNTTIGDYYGTAKDVYSFFKRRKQGKENMQSFSQNVRNLKRQGQ